MDETRVRSTAAEVVVSQEQLKLSTEWHVIGRVRIAKRVVTEERTVTVTVRREELVVEELPVGAESGQTPPVGPSASAAPVLELTLAEEQIQMIAVPRERVKVYVDQVAGTAKVTEVLSRENVDITGVENTASQRDTALSRDTTD